MTARQTSRRALPRLWLFTDERAEAGLPTVLARLPRGSGVVFRHYATAPEIRRALYEKVRAIARARRLVLVLAGTPALASAWRADGAHGPQAGRRTARPLLRTMAAHDARDLVRAWRSGVDLAFVSPVFATRSHPGAKALGTVGFGLMARSADLPVVALGGMDRARFRGLVRFAHGWAGIDAWSDNQKLKVVPR